MIEFKDLGVYVEGLKELFRVAANEIDEVSKGEFRRAEERQYAPVGAVALKRYTEGGRESDRVQG